MLSCYLPGGNGPSKHWQKKPWIVIYNSFENRPEALQARATSPCWCVQTRQQPPTGITHTRKPVAISSRERKNEKNRVYNPAWSLRATVEGVIIRLVASTFHSRPFGQKRRRARHATLLSAKISAILRIKKNKYSVILTVGPEQRVRLWSFRLLRAIER